MSIQMHCHERMKKSIYPFITPANASISSRQGAIFPG
jgi:hypothetical protein